MRRRSRDAVTASAGARSHAQAAAPVRAADHTARDTAGHTTSDTAIGRQRGLAARIGPERAGTILRTSQVAMAFQALKVLGVVYLLYMAWVTLRDQGTLTIETDTSGRSDREVIQSAILVNALNPKLAIFFFAFLPQFVHADDPQFFARMLGLSGVFMALTLVVFVIYGLLAAALRLQIISRPRVVAWMRRAFAAAFVALGVRLALQEK